jgi:tRNA(Ile)-lysidine synthase
MNVRIKSGMYVVAVSGGVDSMALLHMLAQKPKLKLVVAHFDHGIRPDSKEDRKLVQKVAKHYDLPYVLGLGRLGPKASEEKARNARYAFLRKVMTEQGAEAIITAHHQDDMLETAILNLLRGTGRRGLTSLKSTKDLRRPLLHMTKKDIWDYAADHNLEWREDGTNEDDQYLRNYVRHNILGRFGQEGRESLLKRVERARSINREIDDIIEQDLAKQPAGDQLDRNWYLKLPYAVATEVMVTWLRRNGIGNFDRDLIENLVVAAKTKRPGKLADINANFLLEFGKETIKLLNRKKD